MERNPVKWLTLGSYHEIAVEEELVAAVPSFGAIILVGEIYTIYKWPVIIAAGIHCEGAHAIGVAYAHEETVGTFDWLGNIVGGPIEVAISRYLHRAIKRYTRWRAVFIDVKEP